jgi:hypothetical protein
VTGQKNGLRELEDMEAMVEMEGARALWALAAWECAGADAFIAGVHRRHSKCGTSRESYLFTTSWLEFFFFKKKKKITSN